MVAIFNNPDSALRYSDKVHQWLIANRPGYCAERWADLYKCDTESLWGIQLPVEQETASISHMIAQDELKDAVLKAGDYPDGWSVIALKENEIWPHEDRPIRVYITHAQVTAMIESPYKALIDYALSVPYVKDSNGVTLWLVEFGNEQFTDEQVRGVLESFGAVITFKPEV